MSKKTVECSGCGFLCWYSHTTDTVKELEGVFRKELNEGRSQGEAEFIEGEFSNTYRFHCYRRQWTFNIGGHTTYQNPNQIDHPRECRYFYKYDPSYDPEGHKELISEWRLRNITWHAALLGSGVGAAGAIAAQLIYMLLTKGN
jgi:hypothetical protein